MWAAIGIKTNEIYVRGESKAEVCRKLLDKYPSAKKDDRFNHKGVLIKQIYPEPLRIKKVR